MKRTLALSWLLLGLLAVGPAVTSAQDGGIGGGQTKLIVTLLKVGDTTYNAAAKRPLNASECADPELALTFRIDGLLGNNTNPGFLDVWLGSNCNTTTRLDTTSGNSCKFVTTKEIVATDKMLAGMTVPASVLCATQGEPTLYFLGVKTSGTAEQASCAGTLAVKIDTVAPTAPTSVHGGAGETEIPLSWKSASADVDHYLLVWDPAASSQASPKTTSGGSGEDGGGNPAGPAECSSSVLMAGDELGGEKSALPDGISGKRLDGKVQSTTLSGDELGSDLAAVGVIAIDLAGNASLVSSIACLKVVPTTGFWDQYRSSGGTTQEGCACSTPGQTHAPGAAWPVALAMCALGLRARRRRT